MPTLIDFAQPGASGDGKRLRLAFGEPRQTLVAHQHAQVVPVLDAVQQLARQGLWCVGYLRYEAAAAFDAALTTHAADGPLAWFGVYEQAQPWPDTQGDGHASVAWREPLSRTAFDNDVTAIRAAIADGEFYQVNYTTLLAGTLQGSADALFHALQRAQPGGFAACIDTGPEQVLSVSPELFFDWDGQRLLARPMKGTAARGATSEADARAAQALQASPKERAENVMIVDLIRNDLSRVAEPFSVEVPSLFALTALPSVWQMTSDVVARTRADTTLADVFAALFPCGSVTGAPKVRAMQEIREREPGPRGVYCGAVGVVQPGGATTFNVAIRTVTVRGSEARCGIGSAITFDASACGEWQEWQHKRAFLNRASQPFALLETLALEEGTLRHAPAHLARLAGAAAHFGYPWQAEQVRAGLDRLVNAHRQGLWRVRLLLDAAGQLQTQAYAMEASPKQVRLMLATTPLADAHSEFVRFKTTRRAHYEAFAPDPVQMPGIFDTLLWNPQREITECTRGNLAVQLDGRWVTPPLRCGLLGGVGRAHCLAEGRLVEAVVTLDDLPRVTGLAFLNSLRGWVEAVLV